jgi:hypothetical protein
MAAHVCRQMFVLIGRKRSPVASFKRGQGRELRTGPIGIALSMGIVDETSAVPPMDLDQGVDALRVGQWIVGGDSHQGFQSVCSRRTHEPGQDVFFGAAKDFDAQAAGCIHDHLNLRDIRRRDDNGVYGRTNP